MGRLATAWSSCFNTAMFLPLSKSSHFIELLIPVCYSTHILCNLAITLFPSLLISHERHIYMVFPLGVVSLLSAALKTTTVTHSCSQDLEAAVEPVVFLNG